MKISSSALLLSFSIVAVSLVAPQHIGTGSCAPADACFDNHGVIGDRSCRDGTNHLCAYNYGAIGDASCHGESACQNNTENGNIGVGDGNLGACYGDFSCKKNEGSIGFYSCIGENSCPNNEGTIGKQACYGVSACENNKGTIDDGCCKWNETWVDACNNNEGHITC